MEQLVGNGLVTDLPSFFELQVPQMAALPGFGSKIAEKISASLREKNRPELEQMLTAIGVSGVGPKACKSLAKRFDNFAELVLASRDRLVTIEGVSEKAASNLRAFFDSPGGEKLVVRFRQLEML